MCVLHLARGEVQAAAASSHRRLELLGPLALRPEMAFELTDALHMASLTSIGAGDLAAARGYAERRLDLPFHREEDHLVVNWVLVRAALAGDLGEAVELGQRFLAGWDRAGRPRLRAFAAAPAAAAMVHGLRGDDEARGDWLAVYAEMCRDTGGAAEGPSAYSRVFDAIVALHRGAAGDAGALLAEDPDGLDTWTTGLWRQWYAALWAEAGVLVGGPDRADRLVRARAATARNPIAAAIVDRADALAAGDTAGLLATAAAFDAAGCPYQRARALVLAGGAERAEGEALLAAMGAAPMQA
jgi:hypothetical protein